MIPNSPTMKPRHHTECPVGNMRGHFVQQGPEKLTDKKQHERGRSCMPKTCEELDVEQNRDAADAPVTLHVYYVGNSDTIEDISVGLQDFLGAGGVFHGAVEVYGREWSFGGCPEGSGVFQVKPRSCCMHRYRESIYMGDCGKTEAEVFMILREMIVQWQGNQYDLLRHNCCSFSDKFCIELGVGPIPTWVHSLADTGAALADDEQALINGLHSLEDGVAAEIHIIRESMGLDDPKNMNGQVKTDPITQ